MLENRTRFIPDSRLCRIAAGRKSRENASFCKKMALTYEVMLKLVISVCNETHNQNNALSGSFHFLIAIFLPKIHIFNQFLAVIVP